MFIRLLRGIAYLAVGVEIFHCWQWYAKYIMFEFDAQYTKIHLFCRLPETSICNFMTEIINLDLSLQFMSPSLSDQIFFHFCFHVKHSFLGRCRLQWEEFWRWRGGGTPQAPDLLPLRRPDPPEKLGCVTIFGPDCGNMALPGLVSHSSGLAEEGYISVKVNLFN